MSTSAPSKLRLGFHLTKAEFSKKHAATIGGLFWTFFTPIATIFTIWIALDFGLGMRAIAGPAYGQSLMVGLAAWLFISEAVLSGSQAIVSNPHFVKKVKFPVEVLPWVAVMSAFVVHLVLLALVLALLAWQGVYSGWPLASLPLWIVLALIIGLALARLTSALTVVIPDVGALLPSIVAILFWLTPIVWPLSTVNEQFRWLFMANPATIVVEGYRYALLGKPIDLDLAGIAGAGAIVALIVLAALVFFRRVRPLFADMM
jgi:ABC-type polysaccharide/polyol phosphate export permease